MRPILYGLIAFFSGGVLWLVFSIYAALEELAGETSNWRIGVYVFGLIFFFSLPVAIAAEIIRWYKRRKKTHG